jgi:hypothetical protein
MTGRSDRAGHCANVRLSEAQAVLLGQRWDGVEVDIQLVPFDDLADRRLVALDGG